MDKNQDQHFHHFLQSLLNSYNLGTGGQSCGIKERLESDERLDKNKEDNYTNPNGKIKIVGKMMKAVEK